MKTIVSAQKLAKNYGDFRALKGISFSVQAGECFGFLGHNGAGKSTTMRMIYGLSTVEEGVLTLFDEPVQLTPPSIKQRLGVVSQEDNLDPDLSVLENLIVYGELFGMSRSAARQSSLQLLEWMGLEDKMLDAVDSLSGGLKRRLVIARALINNPELVILDEPTTGLDPQARHLVWQKLRGLKNQGVTLLLTTHYMDEATQLCDRLVIMHEGEILAEGNPRDLIAKQVLPYVIEVHVPLEEIPSNLDTKVRQSGGETLQVLDGLFIYGTDENVLWEKLASWELPAKACFLRASTLEDVFLKLTGRGESA